jgi:hypothetical protein
MVVEVIVATGLASIHLVKYSTVVDTFYLCFLSLTFFGKGTKRWIDHLIRVYIDNFHKFWWIYESIGTIQKICKETTLEDSRRLRNSTWLSTQERSIYKDQETTWPKWAPRGAHPRPIGLLVGPVGPPPPAPNLLIFWNVPPPPMRINLNHMFRLVWSYDARSPLWTI